MKNIESLEELKDALERLPGEQPREIVEAAGLPYSEPEGGVQWANLPTFGGDEPDDTTEVWSWDEGRLLVLDTEGRLEIIDRGK